MFEDVMRQMRVTFRQEALDLLEEFDTALLALDAEPKNADAINRVFRVMHTIKGSGAAAGFDHMSHFAHGIEDIFIQAREGEVGFTAALVDSALQACDVFKLMLNAAEEEAASLEVQSAQILTALRAAAGAVETTPGVPAPTSGPVSSGVSATYNLVFRPKRGLFYSGTDPVLLLDELRQLGQLKLTAHLDDVPLLEELDPELCYTWWTAVFTTTRPFSQVQNVFEFVQDDCHVQFDVVPSVAATVNAAEAKCAARGDKGNGTQAAFQNTAWQCMEAIDSSLSLLMAGEREVGAWRAYLRSVTTLKCACEFCGKTDLVKSLNSQVTTLEVILDDQGNCPAESLDNLARAHQSVRALLDRRQAAVPPPDDQGAPRPFAGRAREMARQAQAEPPQTIRIDQSKLDKLMRAVGELLVARGVFPTISRKLVDDHQLTTMAKDVRDAGASIARIGDELQEAVMAMRMLPIRTTLQKFSRMVRDMSRSLGKNITFAVEGEETELDKAVIEQISDALVHLVRNSADHGIEMPDERVRKGKSPEGILKIRASNEGSQVVLQVGDDARGWTLPF